MNSYNSAVLPSPSVETPQGPSWFLANNQINSWAYDTAGNVTGIPALGGSTVRAACAANTMVGVATLRTSCYDAENRMTSETPVILEAAVEAAAAQCDDGVGAANRPGPGAFATLGPLS